MPEKKTKQRALKLKREGKAPTTQAGEFVREEMHHVREGKHGAQSNEQTIAIGLSKARRAGIAVPPQGKTTKKKKANQKRSRSSSKPTKSAARKRKTRTARG
jgi:hypothetical protein